MKRSRVILIVAAVAVLLLACFQVKRLNDNLEKANDTAEQAVEMVDKVRQSVGEEARDVLDRVDKDQLADDLEKGLRGIGGDIRKRFQSE